MPTAMLPTRSKGQTRAHACSFDLTPPGYRGEAWALTTIMLESDYQAPYRLCKAFTSCSAIASRCVPGDSDVAPCPGEHRCSSADGGNLYLCESCLAFWQAAGESATVRCGKWRRSPRIARRARTTKIARGQGGDLQFPISLNTRRLFPCRPSFISGLRWLPMRRRGCVCAARSGPMAPTTMPRKSRPSSRWQLPRLRRRRTARRQCEMAPIPPPCSSPNRTAKPSHCSNFPFVLISHLCPTKKSRTSKGSISSHSSADKLSRACSCVGRKPGRGSTTAKPSLPTAKNDRSESSSRLVDGSNELGARIHPGRRESCSEPLKSR